MARPKDPDEGCARTVPVRVENGRILLGDRRVMTATTCPYCGVGCGVIAGADGSIKADSQHPSNRGRLCSKGAALGRDAG